MNAYQLQHLDKTLPEIRKDSEDLKEIKQRVLESPGLKFALVALSFFQRRWDLLPQYKNATRVRNQKKTRTDRTRSVELARIYIRKAREAGYRGYPHREIPKGGINGYKKINLQG